WAKRGLGWSCVSSDESGVGVGAAAELVRLLGGAQGETIVVTSPAGHADRTTGFVRALREDHGFPEPRRLAIAGRSEGEDAAAVWRLVRANPQVVGAFATEAASAAALARGKTAYQRGHP